MSHSKGFLSTCSGRWVNHRKPHEGIQQQKCGKCGRIREIRVRPCFLFHDFRKKGKAVFGEQKRACARCGQERMTKARPCFLFHRYSGKGQARGEARCVRCGSPRTLKVREAA
jgi:ribosomal protein S27AE